MTNLPRCFTRWCIDWWWLLGGGAVAPLFLLLSPRLPETWSELEIRWTAWALGMTLPSLYGLVDALLDLRAAYRGPRQTTRNQVAAWCWLSASVFAACVFVGFALLGWISGQQPPRPVTVSGVQTNSSDLSAMVLFVILGAGSLCLLLGLWAKRWLHNLPLDESAERNRIRDEERDEQRDPERDLERDTHRDPGRDEGRDEIRDPARDEGHDNEFRRSGR